MIVSCENCGKQFKIPPEKVPDCSKFSLKCPGCGEKIVVVKEEEISRVSNEELTIEPEMHPPGSIVAFICVEKAVDLTKITSYLEQKGYIISTANNIEEAVLKLRLNRYDLIIFLDNHEGKRLLNEIHLWPGNLRRNRNIIVIGDKAKTFDPNIEFLMGINSYINLKDIDKIEELLDTAIKRHEDFLQPWKFIINEE